MPLKIVRNDITQMHTDAIVNTANTDPIVGAGCDYAIYQAAGYDALLQYRTEKIGAVPEGEAFLTPAFQLDCSYIIHVVSPVFYDGKSGEEEKLRACYQNGLRLALEQKVQSIAFPLISTGSFGYPMEEGLRIAVDEINAFLLKYEMEMIVYLVVFDEDAVRLSSNITPDLKSYINRHYVEQRIEEEYYPVSRNASVSRVKPSASVDFYEVHESALQERMLHLSDTFSEYLLYLIDAKGLSYAEVYKRAIVDKKVFSKIKNNLHAHPKKITALCLCIGAKLNLNETRELLARAGYALSPCDKTDLIFSYFIEHQIYDMIALDIQLEEYGLPCLIS